MVTKTREHHLGRDRAEPLYRAALKLKERGLTVIEIAAAQGVPRQTVYYRLKRARELRAKGEL